MIKIRKFQESKYFLDEIFCQLLLNELYDSKNPSHLGIFSLYNSNILEVEVLKNPQKAKKSYNSLFLGTFFIFLFLSIYINVF